MSKELLENLLIEFDELGFEPTTLYDSQREVDSFRNRLKQVLDYLKAIDNANPSEALERFEHLKRNIMLVDNSYEVKKDYPIIKQALLKSQEQEDKIKAFDLINEKDIDVKLLKWAYPSVEAYNVKVRTEKDYWWRKELTPEEFEFIGRLAGAK